MSTLTNAGGVIPKSNLPYGPARDEEGRCATCGVGPELAHNSDCAAFREASYGAESIFDPGRFDPGSILGS